MTVLLLGGTAEARQWADRLAAAVAALSWWWR